MTKTGQIAALTNMTSFDPPGKRAKKKRGFLVTNYLSDNAIDGKSYLESLRQEKYLFRPFNIIAGNVLNDIFHTNNQDEMEERKLLGLVLDVIVKKTPCRRGLRTCLSHSCKMKNLKSLNLAI